MKLQYNAPVTLTFALLCCLATGLIIINPTTFMPWFSVSMKWAFNSPVWYLSLFTHVLGHADVSHLMANMPYILLLGPVLEEKYGGGHLLLMIAATALIAALLNQAFFNTGLLGASGIVFMMILLTSVGTRKKGYIPITFLAVSLIYLGGEIVSMLEEDSISQFAHLLGGICGSIFGFAMGPTKEEPPKADKPSMGSAPPPPMGL